MLKKLCEFSNDKGTLLLKKSIFYFYHHTLPISRSDIICPSIPFSDGDVLGIVVSGGVSFGVVVSCGVSFGVVLSCGVGSAGG